MYNINYLETSALVTYHLKSLWFYTFCLFVTLIFQTSLGRQKLLMTSCLTSLNPNFLDSSKSTNISMAYLNIKLEEDVSTAGSGFIIVLGRCA